MEATTDPRVAEFAAEARRKHSPDVAKAFLEEVENALRSGEVNITLCLERAIERVPRVAAKRKAKLLSILEHCRA